LKKFVWLLWFGFSCNALRAQYSSLATDVSILRSFTKGSSFWAIGQTVQGQYHFTEKTAGYASVCYYTNGRFKNRLTAVATDSTVTPQQLEYITKSTLRFRQVSLGFRHYFKGAYNSESTWSLYGIAGFGLLLIKATNSYNTSVDTALYSVPQQALAGTKNIVRLTADVGLGVETLLGSAIYLYADVRTWIQASRFPSPYLYTNAVPRVAVLSGGVRILFD
jgi:hypothetical protein